MLGELLADWDGQLTEDTRDLVSWHIGECQTCAHHGWGALRPTAFSRLLPLAPLPPELREQVLSLCTSAAEDAVAYRRQVTRRAESIWFARFSQASRLLSWDSIQAHPGVAIATTAVAVRVVAAVSVTLLIFAGSHAAHAQTLHSTSSYGANVHAAQTSSTASSKSPAATAAARTSAAARSSPTVTQRAPYVSSPVQPSPQASRSPSPSPSRSTSSSPSRRNRPRPRVRRRPRLPHLRRRRLEVGGPEMGRAEGHQGGLIPVTTLPQV